MRSLKIAATALVVLAAAIPAAAQTAVFINEIHYDNDGTDAGEAIEIAGPVGTDLTGWSVVLYNGSNGLQYNTTALFDTIADLCAGFGVIDLTYPVNGIQNGSPDGIALVDAAGTVVQFLSYEGSFTAADGPAAGLTSTDIGVAEVSATPIGDSLQLAGTGLVYEDFSWAVSAPHTFGACNTGQTFGAAVPLLVINEIDYDQPGTDTGEFIEIKNTGTSAVDLSTYAIELVNGTGGGASVYQTIDLPAVALASGAYFVVCADAATTFNCDLDVSPDTNLIQNGSPDAVALVQGATLIDTISYEGDTGSPYTEGSGAGLEDSSSTDFLGIARFPDGVDTDQNNVDLSPRCITPGTANSTDASGCTDPFPAASDLVINEIDYDQPGTDTAEFIELKNTGSSPVDLGSFSLELINGSGTSVYATIPLPSTTLAPGDYFVVCADAATTFNCDLDVAPDTNLIQNGSPDAVALVQGATLIDTVSYEGDTGVPYTEGSGSGLEDSGSTGSSFKGISRLPDGFDSDQNNLDFAFVCITPGAPNTAADIGCGAAGPVLEIYEIQGAGAFSPFVGSPVSTEDNIVTAVDSNGFFIQTPAARSDGDPQTSDGIFVFTGVPPSVAAGDQVDVSGIVAEFFDFTEISGSPSVTVDSSGNPLPVPVTLDEALPSGFPVDLPELERLEGMLVTASGIATGPSDQFGDVPVVARTVRSYREPGIEYPGLPGLPVWDGNPEVFEIDPNALGLPELQMFANQAFSAAGPLGFAFGDYQIWPTSLAAGPPPDLPTAARDPLPGEFTVASQNLLRLSNLESDFGIRAPKISLHIRTVLQAPDILAVQEVDTIATLQALADQIAADDPAVLYTPYLIEGNDIGGIDVGFLVRDTVLVNSVTQHGAELEFFFDGEWRLTYDRPPLVLDAAYIGAGEPFPIVIIANHLRSLNGIEDETSIARTKRYEQSLDLSRFIQSFQITDPDTPLLVTGDFNAFEFTDGYVDMMGQITGNPDPAGALLPATDEVDPDLFNELFTLPPAERYSFVFGGDAQTLDHMLTSVPLQPAVTGIQYPRGNADSPAALFLAAGTPLRSSDHDGVVLYLLADSDFDGVPNGIDRCPGTVIPESVPTDRLGTNRWALVDEDRIFDTTLPNGNGTGLDRSFTIEDTAGCSCEQIIDELHLGSGHTKFGCSTGVMESWIMKIQP
jgi:predicted extracellular nuclease